MTKAAPLDPATKAALRARAEALEAGTGVPLKLAGAYVWATHRGGDPLIPLKNAWFGKGAVGDGAWEAAREWLAKLRRRDPTRVGS